MKSSTRSTTNKQSKQGNSKKPRPEIRDDMDSRQRKDEAQKKSKVKAKKANK